MANFIFPKPEISNPKYSTRDLGTPKNVTFAPGCLVPVLMKDVLPGDHFTINLNSLIESLPMIAPALDGWKANFDFYFEPWSNIYGFMDNNRREGTEDLINKKRHTFDYGVDYSSDDTYIYKDVRNYTCVHPGSFLDMYGLPPGYFGDADPDGAVRKGRFPAEKWLAYWDVIRNYYVNNQEGRFPVCIRENLTNTLANGGVEYFPLSVLDDMMMAVRMSRDGFDITDPSSWPNVDGYDMDTVARFIAFNFDNTIQKSNFHGLGLRTYRMDLNRGIMNAEVGNLKSRVQVTDNQFSIDTLRFANKMQKLIDRFDVSGGRFSDWMRSQWSVKVRGNLDIPDYLGTVSEFFGNTDIVCTSNGAVSTSTGVKDSAKMSILGQQAGFAVGRVKRDNKPISFKSDQYGTLVCIFSLVPIVNYSQGIERENLKTTFADVYSPAMAQLGYQDVDRRELSALPVLMPGPDSDNFRVNPDYPTVDAPSVGKRVAWSEYMASLGRNHGYFAYGEELDYWVNQRQYSSVMESGIASNIEDDSVAYWERFGYFDETTYVLPGHWNYLFAATGREDMNFRLRCRFDITAKRPIGSRLMPHL